MVTPNRVDNSTLGWLKSEIDRTLDEAREALQQYIEGSDDLTPLRLFANSVHQVAGTLQMVELDGAAQLAQETESLASAVVSGKVERNGSPVAGDLLGEGLDHLSSYMEGLANGLPDRPIDNVDVINVLRRARHAEELDPFSLFHPDLAVYPSRDASTDAAGELQGAKLDQHAPDLRRRYQAALLRWLRDQDDGDAWQQMADVVSELYALSRFQASMQVWWVARAYLDVLKASELGRDDPRKHSLAALDQLMRKLCEDSEAAIAREGSEKLVRYMLYQIGRSGVGTDAIRAVTGLFELDTLLGAETDEPPPPGARALEAIRDKAMGPLRFVRNTLEHYSRTGNAGDTFDACAARLDEIADAAREAGVQELADVSTGVRRMLFDNDSAAPDEDVLLAAARALLFIEETLGEPENVSPQWRQEAAVVLARLSDQEGASEAPGLAIESFEVDTDNPEAPELHRLVAAVSNQIADSVKEAEQNLERFAGDTADTGSLTSVETALQQVHGAVRMLGRHKLSDLLELATNRIHALIAGEAAPTESLMDALAVSIGTTEAYVQGMERQAPNIDALLNRAMSELENADAGGAPVGVDPESTLKKVQDSFGVWITDNADYEAFRTLRRSLRDIAALAQQQRQLNLQRIAKEMVNLLDIVTDDPSFLSEEVENTLRRSLSTLGNLAVSLAPAAPGEGEAAGEPVSAAADSGEEDDLVRQTFAEEAGECLDEVQAGLQALANDYGDASALAGVRRSFHTIKGSGRMARAGDIAELAWVVENVLNRCLDGGAPVTESVIDFVSQALGELRRLLAEGLDSSTDLGSWERQAAALVQEADEPEAGEAQAAASGPGAAAASRPIRGFTEDAEAGSEPGIGTDAGRELVASDGEAGGGRQQDAAAERDRSASPLSDNEVIKIFTKEALSHIAAIRKVADECNRRGEAAIDEELLRAVHTLQGNARSLHLVEMSQAYTALDRTLHAKKSNDAGLYQSEMQVLDTLLICTAKVLDHLNRDKRFPDVVRHELSELANEIEQSWSEAGPVAAGRGKPGGLELVSDLVSDQPGSDRAAGPAQAVDTGAGTASVFDQLTESDAKARRAEAAQSVPTDLSATDAAAGAGLPTSSPEAEEQGGDTNDRDADTALKDVFIEEATDILSRIESALQQGRRSGLEAELSNGLKRELHTLKGSARTAGVESIGDLSHDAESMLEHVSDPARAPSDLLELLEEVHDGLASMVQALEEGHSSEVDPRLAQRLRSAPGAAAADTGSSPTGPVSLIPEEGAAGAQRPQQRQPAPPDRSQSTRKDGGDDAPDAPAADTRVPVRDPDGAARPAAGRATVRIRSNVLDKLVNYAGEVSISRAQLEQQLGGLKGNLNELRANVARFSDQVRELDIQADSQIRSRVTEEQVSEAGHDFDPLELDRYSRLQQLSRSLSESVDDLVTIQTGLNRFAAQTEGVLSQQAMLNNELQDGLMSARMVPFNTLVPRLRHQARQTARELGKEVDFSVTGGEIEVDRNILDQLGEALDHMIRNALDHGIETAAARKAAGKPERGSVRIDCRQEGSEVVLEFSDDGAGLDVGRIKARAVESRLLAADSDLSDDEIIQLIVLSGFSTAESVTQLSGRGVGLDVVNDAVRRLGGSLTMDNRPGKGVSFEMRLPLSLSITRAMFVRCGGQRFAIPLGIIESVLTTEPQKLVDLSKDGDPLFKHGDRVYMLMDLPAALRLERAVPGKRVPVLLVRMGAREVAVRVDELIETDEIVVKQLGDHLGRMSGINGATITGDGSVVLILDLAALWLAQERQPAIRQEAPSKVAALPKVMVVDDSLTVRKVTARNLGRHGMEVIMARDGIDAMDQLAKTKPDLMLVDIEMPRMDGYELTTRIRDDANYRDIPIIVITSRAGAKHRERALELGANAYLTKPYQERELLEEVNALLERGAQPALH